MGHQKPDPYKQLISNLTPPPEHTIPPRDPEIYLSTSPWQIMSYDYELRLKALLIEEIFVEAGLLGYLEGLKAKCNPRKSRFRNNEDPWASARFSRSETVPISNLISLPLTDNKDFFYRNKMEYALYWDNTEQLIKLAFHQRNSHRKIPFTHSSIERPEILTRAKAIIADLNARGEQARTYQSLLLRCDQQGVVSGGLLKNHEPHPTFPPLTDRLLGHPYTYSVGGFFQINLPIYELALTEIAKHLGDAEKVLDLYAGVGTIGLSTARDRHLTLVETNPAAFAELERNVAILVQIESFQDDVNSRAKTPAGGFLPGEEVRLEKTHLKPILAKSEEATSYITPDTTVIVDPPRAGLHPKLIEKLNQTIPPIIIYLSCNPITQARDIAALTTNYAITHLQPYNFFPRTPHIENLVVLTRK